MAREIRFKEALVEIRVSGVRMGGSMTRVFDFRYNPDATISKLRFAGESRAQGDLDIVGYDFSFTHYKRDRIWFDLWNLIQTAEENGDELPEISLSVTERYRDGSGTGLTLVFHGDDEGGVVMKMDGDERANGEYQQVSWSGFAPYCTGS